MYNELQKIQPFSFFKKDYCKNISFLKLRKYILNQSYDLFPVPKKLINKMVNFSLNNPSLKTIKFNCNFILKKYLKDWKYYKEFIDNLKLMVQKNCDCTISIITFKTKQQLEKILQNIYPNEKILQDVNNNNNDINGLAYSYGQKLNIAIAINNLNKNYFQIFKIIQHQLIHWMQVTLNYETSKNYGIFKNINHKLLNYQKQYLYEIIDEFFDEKDIDQYLSYVFSEKQYEAWIANCIQDFHYLKLSIEEFQKILNDLNLFMDVYSDQNEIGKQLLLFSLCCKFIQQNDNTQNTYFYLIQALKCHEKII